MYESTLSPGEMLGIITRLTIYHPLRKIILSQDYLHLHFSLSSGSSYFHVSIGHFNLFSMSFILIIWLSFFLLRCYSFLSDFKTFSVLNIIIIFNYLHYKYLIPNLLFINCLKYVFPYTNFRCLCNKYVHILFYNF